MSAAAAVVHVQEHVQEHVMHKDQVGTLLDLSCNLLSDNNFKVR